MAASVVNVNLKLFSIDPFYQFFKCCTLDVQFFQILLVHFLFKFVIVSFLLFCTKQMCPAMQFVLHMIIN